MTTLLRVKEITKRLETVQEAQKYEKEAEDLQNKLDLLSQRRRKLGSAIDQAIVPVNNSALAPRRLPDMEKTRQVLQTVSDAFVGSARSLTSGRNFTTLQRNIDKLADSIGEQSATAWKEHTKTVPRVNETLLRRIEQIRSQTAAVNRIRYAVADLKRSTGAVPTTQEAWNVYVQARQKVEEQLRQLNPDQFPQAVLDFCRAAQGEGATLDMLTDDVRTWLEEQGMLGNLRYRLL